MFGSFSVVFGVCANAAKPYAHSWDTVGDVIGMHGKYKSPPPLEGIKFAAANYPLITTGTGCSNTVNLTYTIEDSVLDVARQIKAVNPDAKVGMYWRSDFALELKECSGFSAEWNRNAVEWRLKDDTGKPVGDKEYLDYSNPAVSAFFEKVLVNVTKALLPSGKPVLDMVYIDGDPGQSRTTMFDKGINPVRSAKLVRAVYTTFANIQRSLDNAGFGQIAILNGMDDAWSAAAHAATGAGATMFDHFSILQFLNRTNGNFNATMMDEAFSLIESNVLSNMTTEVKGWPGPIIKQRDQYPPNIPTPTTPSELQKVASERFNSELALFLIAATVNDFWLYSWFWGWDDWVPGAPDSTVPTNFFPEVKCPLGAPEGSATRITGTYQYKREFAHASVFVDLENRMASKVIFKGC